MAKVRTLEIPLPIKRRLLHLRFLTGVEAPAQLDEQALAAAEAAIGRKLEDPVLAVLANGDEVTRQRFDIRLDRLVSVDKDCHQAGMPPGIVGLGRDSEEGVYIGMPTRGLLVFRQNEEGSTMLPTETWLDELIAAEVASLRDEEGDEKARIYHTVKEDEVSAFEMQIVRSDVKRRTVRHAKFGVGEVLSEQDGGAKLEIRFGDGSVKTLLARFVSDDY